MRTRRKFTSEFKSRVVLELLSGEKTVAEACREYELTAQMVKRLESAVSGSRTTGV